MPEMPKIPGMDKLPEMPKMPEMNMFGKKTATEKVAGMDEETKSSAINDAAKRIAEATWEAEIPVSVKEDLELIFAVLDASGNGSILLADWSNAGLEPVVFEK